MKFTYMQFRDTFCDINILFIYKVFLIVVSLFLSKCYFLNNDV
jgi:hypothetical protein